MTREILGERPKIKYSQFLKQNLNKEGLKTLLIDLDETLVSQYKLLWFWYYKSRIT